MQKLQLVRYLLQQSNGPTKTPATIAKQFNSTESVVDDLKNKINDDGVYEIRTKQRGGLSISEGPKDEAALYSMIEKHLENWISESIYGRHGVTHQIVEPTHRKKLSGKWSTPDFSSVCVHKFLHVPGSIVEIASLEAKHSEKQFDISCVYEAFAHTRVSAYSVLFFFESPARTIADRKAEAIFEEIKVECGRLGVGLITSSYPTDLCEWRYLIPARQQNPDRRRVDAYIEEAFNDEQQKRLKKWT